MSETTHTAVCSGFELFYRDYASASEKTPVICLHGLTRNSLDFEDVAPVISESRRVLSLDFRGRGHSEWDSEWRNYQPLTYAEDTRCLLEQAEVPRAIFFGTSLGGLVSMILAYRHPELVAGVILNDIGPEIDPVGLSRITEYTGMNSSSPDWPAAVTVNRQTYGDAWPGLSDERWLELTRRTHREGDDGRIHQAMDPQIGRAIREAGVELGDPWDLFDALKPIPAMVLRGAHSNILATPTVQEMQRRKPDLVTVEIPNRGHVPLLDEPESGLAIKRFLEPLP